MKKPYSNFVITFSSIVILLSLIACGEETSSYQDPQFPVHETQDPESGSQSDSILQVKILLEDVLSQMNEISDQNEASKEKINNLESSIKELKNGSIWKWIALGTSGVALILSFLAFQKYINLSRLIEEFESKLDKYPLEGNKPIHKDHFRNEKKNVYEEEFKKVKNRVLHHEKEINNIYNRLSRMQTPQAPSSDSSLSKIPERQQTEEGYFGIPVNDVEPYFNKIFKTKDSDIYFKVQIHPGNCASFKPFEGSQYLDTFISSDTLRVAIDIIGGYDQENLTSMTVIKEGKAKRKEGRWYIVEKALIKLS